MPGLCVQTVEGRSDSAKGRNQSSLGLCVGLLSRASVCAPGFAVGRVLVTWRLLLDDPRRPRLGKEHSRLESVSEIEAGETLIARGRVEMRLWGRSATQPSACACAFVVRSFWLRTGRSMSFCVEGVWVRGLGVLRASTLQTSSTNCGERLKQLGDM